MSDRQARMKDVAAGIAFLLLGLITMQYLSSMPDAAALFPRMIALGCIGFSVVLLVQVTLRSMQASAGRKGVGEAKAAAGSSEPGAGTGFRAFWITTVFLILSITFVWSLPVVGFELGSVVYVAAGMLLLGGRRALRYMYVPVVVAATLVLVFRVALKVNLPVGSVVSLF